MPSSTMSDGKGCLLIKAAAARAEATSGAATHPDARCVEQPLVVALADLQARLWGQQGPDRIPEIEHAQLRGLVRRRDVVGAEQESIGVLVEHRGRALDRLG